MHKARQVTFERIVENAPATFTAAELQGVLYTPLINLDPFDFAEDVAAYFVGDDENNQQTTGRCSGIGLFPAFQTEKLTGFALRLALTGHTDIPREGDFDFLAEAESVFTPQQPKKKANATEGQRSRSLTRLNPSPYRR